MVVGEEHKEKKYKKSGVSRFEKLLKLQSTVSRAFTEEEIMLLAPKILKCIEYEA
jgi:hypothetical protein